MVRGWKIKVVTSGHAGNPADTQYYLVFESDKEFAVELARLQLLLSASAKIEVVAPAGAHLFYRRGMKPGNVKQYNFFGPLTE
jgi:hypothetical protein